MYETGVTARGRSPLCGTLLAMALIGYARVSTRDQNPQAQHATSGPPDASGSLATPRAASLPSAPSSPACLDYLRPGDTLVCTKLDRLGRSVKHLVDLVMRPGDRRVDLTVTDQAIDTATPGGKLLFHVLAAIAEFERDLICERTRDGLDAARAKGNNGGRRPGLTELQAAEARRMYTPASTPSPRSPDVPRLPPDHLPPPRRPPPPVHDRADADRRDRRASRTRARRPGPGGTRPVGPVKRGRYPPSTLSTSPTPTPAASTGRNGCCGNRSSRRDVLRPGGG